MKSFFLPFTALSSIIAGFIHLALIAPGHGGILPHVLLFSVGGLAQIVLGGLLFWQKKHWLFWSVAIVNGAFSVLLFHSWWLAVPFMGSVEAPNTIGILTAFFQLSALLCSLFLFQTEEKKRTLALKKILFSLAAGSSIFALGHVGELVFPEWKADVQQHGHGAHGH